MHPRAASNVAHEPEPKSTREREFIISSTDGQDETSDETPSQLRPIFELDAMKEPAPKHEPRELCVEEVRGRDTTPVLVHDDATQANVQEDQVIEDVRQRLESLQQIVRREQSRSSVARDGLMDELGDMLDSAIATTMAPPNLQSSQMSRSASMKTSHSPSKLPRSISGLSRSQSLTGTSRAEKPSGRGFGKLEMCKLTITVAASTLQSQSSATGSQEVPDFSSHPNARPALHPDMLDEVPHSISNSGIRGHTSESGGLKARRTGFPLGSPVRERAML